MFLTDDEDKLGFLPAFYGCNGYYSKERFTEEMVGASNGQKHQWIFSPVKMREKLDLYRDEEFLEDVEFIDV